MIQFNLLPDVKLEFIRAQQNKRMVMAVSTLVSAVSVIILIGLLLSVFVFQKQHMNNVSADITEYTKNLNATSDINKILTVQNQLNALGSLHDKKQDTTRIFPFIQQLTPTDISISALTIDYTSATMIVTGTANPAGDANKLAAVNTFVDTLKFTQFSSGDTSSKAFSEVVLSSFGRAENGASFTIALKFNPILFANTETVTLKIPSQVTTRSETEKPNALFNAAETTKE